MTNKEKAVTLVKEGHLHSSDSSTELFLEAAVYALLAVVDRLDEFEDYIRHRDVVRQ